MQRDEAPAIPTRRGIGAALALLAAILLSAAADAGAASKIVYECRPNLCVLNPESGATARLTSDGTTELPYQLPSLSSDGRTLAALRGDDVLVGPASGNLTRAWTSARDVNDVALSPDGTAVAESHSYVENRYGCPLTGGCLELVDRSGATYSVGPATTTSPSYKGGGGVGFLAGGALLTIFYTLADDTHTICTIATPGGEDGPCTAEIRETPDPLSQPAGSPDGKLIAVVVGSATTAVPTRIDLYSAASGTRLRQLVAGGAPSFSPDSASVAYQGADGWIHTLGLGDKGSRKLAPGLSPSWAEGSGPGASVGSRALRYRRGKVAVTVLCGGPKRCAGTVRLRKGKKTIGSRRYSVAKGRQARVAVIPTRRGKRMISAAKRHRVLVVLAPRRGKVGSTTLTLTR